MGGGGDVVSAAVMAKRWYGARVGQLPWERFVVDPVPGPIRLSELMNVALVGDGVGVVGSSTYAVRGGRIVRPQGACVSAILGEPVFVVDPGRKPSELARGLAQLFDEVIGVDVGGDVLGRGCEEWLRSPLSDSFVLAILGKLEDLGVRTRVVVYAPGADGELPRWYILARLGELAGRGALLGVRALQPSDAPMLEELATSCVTEASAQPLRALKGFVGVDEIRRGLRRVEVDLCLLNAYELGTRAVLGVNEVASIIYGEDLDLFTAARKLRELGYTTEFDFEELLWRGVEPGEAAKTVLEARSRRC